MRNHLYCSIIFVFFFSGSLTAGNLTHPDDQLLEHIAARSETIEAEKRVLTLKGKINRLNPVHFDLPTFMLLSEHSFTYKSHWTGDIKTYTGVSFIHLLNLLGLDESATHAEIIASNNYKISIKISDLKKYDYLLAYKLNHKLYSEYAPKEDKGPISIAINFDKHPEIDWEIYKHQLVWFVEAIIVK